MVLFLGKYFREFFIYVLRGYEYYRIVCGNRELELGKVYFWGNGWVECGRRFL